MNIPIYQVDAFTDQPFRGNPAAVCLLEAWPDDSLLQAIALENNLSETAFLIRQGDAYALRWFTPLVEVNLCGHATLASAYAILNHIEPSRREVAFNTRSGILRVTRKGDAAHGFPLAAAAAMFMFSRPAAWPGQTTQRNVQSGLLSGRI